MRVSSQGAGRDVGSVFTTAASGQEGICAFARERADPKKGTNIMPRPTSRLASASQPPKPGRTAQIDDPHLCALLLYIGGLSFSDGYEAELGAIQTAARALLASRPLSTAFGDFLNRPSVFESVMNARQKMVDARLKEASTDSERREAREDARLLCAIRANDGKVVPDAVSGALFDILVLATADAMLLGAAIMHGLLQGGRRERP